MKKKTWWFLRTIDCLVGIFGYHIAKNPPKTGKGSRKKAAGNEKGEMIRL